MANNQYVNKVGLADGTLLIDVSIDTAIASDVAYGKYFHLATGERVQGTNTFDSDTTDANATAAEIVPATAPLFGIVPVILFLFT